MRNLCNYFHLIILLLLGQVSYPQDKKVTVEDYGAIGNGINDDLPAFQKAIKENQIINLQSGKTYYLNNINLDSTSIIDLSDKFIIGSVNTTLKFASNRLPLFLFYNSIKGGIKNIKFLYNGITNVNGSYSASIFKGTPIYNSPKMFGKSTEFSSVILVLKSDNLSFHNLDFQSVRKFNSNYGITYCLNIKGVPGTKCNGITCQNIRFNDCIMGILGVNLNKCNFYNLTSSRRFGNDFCDPGHIIYLAGFRSKTYGDEYNTNCVISKINDLGNSINLNGRCLAPLSLKFCKYLTVTDVYSKHPEGLIQSIQALENSELSNFTWENENTSKALNAIINIAGGEAVVFNKFNNFYLKSELNYVAINTSPSLVKKILNNEFIDFYINTSNYTKIVKFAGQNNRFEGFDISNSNNYNVIDFLDNSINNSVNYIVKKNKKISDINLKTSNSPNKINFSNKSNKLVNIYRPKL